MLGPEAIPSSRELRWPILVVLDAMGEEDSILEFQDRVARHLDLPKGIGDVFDPDTGRPLLTARLTQAAADLYAAGAVDADGDGSRMWITDAGRRLTEADAEELPEGGSAAESPANKRPSIRDWIGAVFESWPWWP